MSDDGDGNGHDPAGLALEESLKRSLPGARIEAGQLVREDGIIAKAAEQMMRKDAGVLITALSAVEDDEHYRQILKLAHFDNPMQQFRAAAALAECRLIGDTEGQKMILDVITAQMAGIKGGLLHEILEALTHTSFTTNYTGKNPHFWNKWRKSDKANSPIGND